MMTFVVVVIVSRVFGYFNLRSLEKLLTRDVFLRHGDFLIGGTEPLVDRRCLYLILDIKFLCPIRLKPFLLPCLRSLWILMIVVIIVISICYRGYAHIFIVDVGF